MLTPAFVICYVSFLAWGSVFVYKRRQRIGRSLIGAYVFSFAVANYIGIAILYLGLDSYRVDVGISDPDLIFRMLVYSIVAFLVVFGTFSLVSSNSTERTTAKVAITKWESLITAGFIIISALVIFQYLRSVNSIALLLALQGSMNDVLLARSEMGNDFGGLHWFRIALVQLPVIIFHVIYMSLSRDRWVNRAFTIVLFGAILILLTLSTEKFAVVQFLAGLLFVRSKYVKKASLAQLVRWGIASVIFVVFLYVTFTTVQDYETAMEVAFSRVFTGSIGTSHFYLEYFPEIEPFLYGRSLPNPMGIMPWEPYSVSIEIMNWKFPHFFERGIIGSSPSVFWAEGYANFGHLGVVLSSLYIGAFIGVFQRVFDRYNGYVFIRAVEGWFYSYLLTVNISGVSEFMKITVLIPLLILLVLPRLRWK